MNVPHMVALITMVVSLFVWSGLSGFIAESKGWSLPDSLRLYVLGSCIIMLLGVIAMGDMS